MAQQRLSEMAARQRSETEVRFLLAMERSGGSSAMEMISVKLGDREVIRGKLRNHNPTKTQRRMLGKAKKRKEGKS